MSELIPNDEIAQRATYEALLSGIRQYIEYWDENQANNKDIDILGEDSEERKEYITALITSTFMLNRLFDKIKPVSDEVLDYFLDELDDRKSFEKNMEKVFDEAFSDSFKHHFNSFKAAIRDRGF